MIVKFYDQIGSNIAASVQKLSDFGFSDPFFLFSFLLMTITQKEPFKKKGQAKTTTETLVATIAASL